MREKGHDQNHQGAGHEVVELRQVGMGDHDQDEVEDARDDQVEQRREACRRDRRREGDNEVDEPLLLHPRRLSLGIDDEGEVAQKQHHVRIEVEHHLQGLPAARGVKRMMASPVLKRVAVRMSPFLSRVCSGRGYG